MLTAALARFRSDRVHYAWVALIVAFTVTLGAVGVRAGPGVIIVPLERAFGWSAGKISGAVSLNILLLGLTGPFIMLRAQGIDVDGPWEWPEHGGSRAQAPERPPRR